VNNIYSFIWSREATSQLTITGGVINNVIDKC